MGVKMQTIPSYLADYEELYRKNPREAALTHFREAKYGLFLHYGLYSINGHHEWCQLKEKIPVAEYEKLAQKFTAEKFDADAIVELVLDSGMKYVNLTTRHHDSFCLWDTKQTPFNSMNAPAKRDLVAELSTACEKRGVAFFLYYSHGRDWKHPHAPNNDEWGGSARPEYKPPESSYAYGAEHDLRKYCDFMAAQIRELLTGYGSIAGIWLDGIGVPLSGDYQKFDCQKLYDLIHGLQPQVLVSYKQGLLGTEDFFAPEHKAVKREDGKPMEICTTMCPGSWGYCAEKRGQHLNADQVWEKLRSANRENCNLLLNTGPLPDGSLDPEDAEAMREVGKRLAKA